MSSESIGSAVDPEISCRKTAGTIDLTEYDKTKTEAAYKITMSGLTGSRKRDSNRRHLFAMIAGTETDAGLTQTMEEIRSLHNRRLADINKARARAREEVEETKHLWVSGLAVETEVEE